MTNILKKQNKYLSISSLSLIFYSIHILLNFLGTPLIKFFYFIEIAFFLYLAFTKNWRDLLIPTFVLFFIEGQGRVISNYNSIIRNIFDIYLLILLGKSIVEKKKIFTVSKIPFFFTILILLHFSWYFIQFFNYQSVGPISVLAASKIYIIPILFFLMFVQEGIDISLEKQNRILKAFIYIIVLQCSLIFFQMSQGDQQLLAISPHYNKIMRGTFINHLFRPFGTSFISGGISVHFAYISAFLFILKGSSKLDGLLKLLTIGIMIIACVIMQVRTSLVQLVLICLSSYFIIILKSKLKILHIPVLVMMFLSIPIAINNADKLSEAFPELNLHNSISRLKALSSISEVKGQRSSFSLFSKTLKEKLTLTPFGLGPGRTGAANAMFVKDIEADLLFDMRYSWTLDNLFISLAIDLGWGMIFYSLLIIGFPFYLLWKVLVLLINSKELNLNVAVCAIALLVILASCWGAIAIPYNPTSFFYWLFLSIAVNELHKRNNNEKNNI